jgi:hypothetical protein
MKTTASSHGTITQKVLTSINQQRVITYQILAISLRHISKLKSKIVLLNQLQVLKDFVKQILPLGSSLKQPAKQLLTLQANTKSLRV